MNRLVIGLLIIINIVIFGNIFRQMRTGKNPILKKHTEVLSSIQSAEKTYFERFPFIVLTRNPFREIGKSTSPVAKPVTIETAVFVKPQIALKGIMYTEKTAEAIVENLSDGATTFVKTGDMVNNATIMDIATDSIIIKQGKTTFKIKADYYEEIKNPE